MRKQKHNKVSNKGLIITICSLIGTVLIAITSWVQPSKENITKLDNVLQQNTTFSYMANVQPSEIYPKGGLVEPQSIIFERVTKDIPTTIHTTFQSEQPIQAEGTFQPTLIIEAGEYWTREIPLAEQQTFQMDGNDQTIIESTYTINLSDVKELISSIEEEINVSPDNYLLKVNPNFEGTIKFNGKTTAITSTEELVFEYGYNKIQLTGETEFSTDIPFETSKMVSNTYPFLPIKLPLLPIRIISTILAIGLAAWSIYQYRIFTTSNSNQLSESEKIDKKYGSRLISITQKVNVGDKSKLVVDSFKALEMVSEEKELPIFRYGNGGEVSYFIIDVQYIYQFDPSNKNITTKPKLAIGSDVTYG